VDAGFGCAAVLAAAIEAPAPSDMMKDRLSMSRVGFQLPVASCQFPVLSPIARFLGTGNWKLETTFIHLGSSVRPASRLS
jgi:hypothetical protein